MKHPFITQLTEQFIAHADPTLKPRQEAYMRHQFRKGDLSAVARRAKEDRLGFA
jgi:hypothetical protein